MTRKETLEAAEACIMRDRNALYDKPEKNFENIAAFWSQYKGVDFEPHDVAVMMILVKVSRIMVSPQAEDHYVDISGYSACAAECATETEP